MPKYEVKMNIGFFYSITAKNGDDARKKADKMLEKDLDNLTVINPDVEIKQV